MKKRFTIFLILIGIFSGIAQEKPIEQEIDTVKTEVVEVITTFNPEIADAKKIKLNPTIKLLKKSKKKKLEYTIFSAPVASTFVPRSGVVKGIDVGVRERIYKNYLATGYGNYNTPFVEFFLHHNTRFKNEFGLFSKYLASQDNVNNTLLNSGFSNFNIGAFYKQEERYFDWKVSLLSEKNEYNWYGLPNIGFNQTTINAINEEQIYNYFKLNGDFKFHDSYIDYTKLTLDYFTDRFKSQEILANFEAKLNFPLDFLLPNLNDVSVKTGVEFLKGNFKNNYEASDEINYAILTVKLHPEYKMTYKEFLFEIRLNTYFSLDSENEATNIFLLPNLKVQHSVIKDYLNIYGGYFSDLKTNTYKEFSDKNPYLSPTQFITQTLEKENLFIGINGKITNDIVFNLKASTISEEDKPLFLRNNTKSDGTSSIVNGSQLKGYEYGNSFSVFYDDVKTTSFFGEIEYNLTQRITIGTFAKYNTYEMTNALESWNLPTIEASLSAKYKNDKWYATTNVFYVSERKDVLYNTQYPSSLKGTESISAFVDVNVNGGYHFNDKFSAFLNLNNILNTQYQRFANFDTQGFQVLGGITYKFDF